MGGIKSEVKERENGRIGRGEKGRETKERLEKGRSERKALRKRREKEFQGGKRSAEGKKGKEEGNKRQRRNNKKDRTERGKLCEREGGRERWGENW